MTAMRVMERFYSPPTVETPRGASLSAATVTGLSERRRRPTGRLYSDGRPMGSDPRPLRILAVLLLLDLEEDDRHVVDAAAGVGIVDQAAADLVEVPSGREALADVGVREHAGEAVRAEEIEIARLHLDLAD